LIDLCPCPQKQVIGSYRLKSCFAADLAAFPGYKIKVTAFKVLRDDLELEDAAPKTL
jgi:hypothetical protein